MRNIYELSSKYQYLYDLDEYDHDAMIELLTTGDDLKSGVCELGKLALEKRAELRAVEDKIKTAKERAMKLDKQIDSLMRVIKSGMCALHLSKLDDDPDVLLAVKKNPPSVHIFDDKAIPTSYIQTETVQKILKKEILNDLKNGVEIPGCEIVQDQRLEIK